MYINMHVELKNHNSKRGPCHVTARDRPHGIIIASVLYRLYCTGESV